MKLTKALLIAVVVILLIMIIRKDSRGRDSRTRTWDCVDRNTGGITTVEMTHPVPTHGHGCRCQSCNNPENVALGQNAEYFSSGMSSCDVKEHAEGTFESNSFGGSGSDIDFKDYISGEAINEQTMRNHQEFVKDRIQNTGTQNITGRTYAMGEIEADGGVPWMGLRRPQHVEVVNPTQATDFRAADYTDKPTFTWNSR